MQYSASVPVTQLLLEAPHSTGQSSPLLPLLAESLSLEDAGNPCQDSEALNMLTWRQRLPSSESRRREIKPHFVPVIIVFSQKTASPALPMKVALFIIQQHQLWGHCGSLVGSLLSQALCQYLTLSFQKQLPKHYAHAKVLVQGPPGTWYNFCCRSPLFACTQECMPATKQPLQSIASHW